MIDPLRKLTHQQVNERHLRGARFSKALFVIHSIVVICLLMLAGCVARPKGVRLLGGTQPLVKIGLAAPFEGLDRPLGYEALAGVKLALAERNSAGGVGGYLVELVALNDFGEPDEARLQAGEFAADPAVVGVVTGWTSETARASLPVYRQVGLAVAVPWSVPSELADRESGIVLVAADVQRAAEILTEAVTATYPSRLVVVGDETAFAPYGKLADALGLEAQMLSLPGALPQGIRREWTDRLLQDQAQSHPALILATHGATAGEALLTLSTENWDGATFGGVEAGSVHLVTVAGSAADGLTFVSPAPARRDVRESERDSALDEEGWGPRAVLAYDATNVLLDAIELAIREDGHPSRRGVVAALPQVQRHGLTGDIAFDTVGRRVDAPVWLFNIVDKSYPGQSLLQP